MCVCVCVCVCVYLVKQCFSDSPDHETYLGALVLTCGFPSLLSLGILIPIRYGGGYGGRSGMHTSKSTA